MGIEVNLVAHENFNFIKSLNYILKLKGKMIFFIYFFILFLFSVNWTENITLKIFS